MIVGILQLPAIVGIPVKPIVIASLMLLAFVVDNYKQRAQKIKGPVKVFL